MYIRLVNDGLSRMLHHFLYERLVAFNKKHCPEQQPEISVNNWLSRLYSNDPNLHILIVLEEGSYNILSHAVIDIIPHTESTMVVCQQLQHDRPDIASLDAGMQYIHNLARIVNAYSIIFFAERHSKAFMERYNFQTARTLMVKHVTQTQEALSQDQDRMVSVNGTLSPV